MKRDGNEGSSSAMNGEDHDTDEDCEGREDKKPRKSSTAQLPNPQALRVAPVVKNKVRVKIDYDDDDDDQIRTLHSNQPPPRPPPFATTYGTPSTRRYENHRVPYFRYFGPTAIVPGYKEMVVSVRDRRRSTGGSGAPASPMSAYSGAVASSSATGSDVVLEDLPVYDPNDPAPVHNLIISLIETFFVRMGSNYPFLKKAKFLRLVKEKRVEAILVDAVCSLAARFSDNRALNRG